MGGARGSALSLARQEQAGKFLESGFSTVLASRSARKVVKAYWNLVKMFVTIAKHEGTLPRWAINACQDFAADRYGVTLLLAKPGADGKAPARVFTEDSVRELKKRSTEHPTKVGFIVFIELANSGLAVYDLCAHWGEPDGWRRVFNLGGAISSTAGALAKNEARRAFFGFVASAADGVLGIGNASDASATGDDRAALFHGATALGGAVGMVGYVVSVVNPPIGAGGLVGATPSVQAATSVQRSSTTASSTNG